MEAPLSPDKASVRYDIPELHSGERGLGMERYFSHWGTKPHSVGLHDSHGQRRRGWVIIIITAIILSSRRLLLKGLFAQSDQINPGVDAIQQFHQLCRSICLLSMLLHCVSNHFHRLSGGKADFSRDLHTAEPSWLPCGPTLLPCAEL